MKVIRFFLGTTWLLMLGSGLLYSCQALSCEADDTSCGWTRTLTDEALGYWPMPRHMAVDSVGNLYLVGETYPEAANYKYTETLLAKYDAAANRLWLRRFRAPGANGFNVAYGVAVDAAGNICLGGITDGSYANAHAPVQRKGFAARYDTNGRQLWAADRPIEVIATAQDGKGSCYAASSNEVVKYDTRGSVVWSYRQRLSDIAVEPVGTLHLIGQAGGEPHPYLITLDVNGKEVRKTSLELGKIIKWGRYGFTRFVLKAAGKGSVYVHASASGIDRQGKPRIETYLAKVAPNGKVAWERLHGVEGQRWDSIDLAADGQGNAYLSGVRQNIFGQGPRNSFVIKYSMDGNLQWVRQYDGASKNAAGSISIDGHGNYFIAGGTEGELDGQKPAKDRRNTPFIARNRPGK